MKNHMQNSRLLSALVGIGSLGFAASHAAAAGTTATTLFDSGGFEPSAGYVTGSLPQYNGSSTERRVDQCRQSGSGHHELPARNRPDV